MVGGAEHHMFFCQTVDDAWAGELSCCNTKSVLSTGLASSCVLLPSNVFNLPSNTLYLLSDHMERIHDEPTLSSQKTPPTSPSCLTDSSGLFFGWGYPFPIHCEDCVFVITFYPYTHVSSPVTMFLMKFSLALAQSSSSWLILTRFSFYHWTTNVARILLNCDACSC